jgi:uncharacterized membrane-anchored protein
MSMCGWQALFPSKRYAARRSRHPTGSRSCSLKRSARRLATIAAAYVLTSVSRTPLFWAAFILTRPLGATLGDLLDKPIADGGFAVSRFEASALLAVLMLICILVFPQRAGAHPGASNK